MAELKAGIVMTEIRSSKYCPGCKQEKARDEFYQNDGCYRDGLSSHCKLCMRARSKRQYEGSREPKSTRRARAVLAAAGIPCTTGKAAGHTWADLAAWGCIPVEAKGCTIINRNGKQRLHWAFSHKQQHDGPADGFFVFLAWFKDDRMPMRCFVVPTSEKWATQQGYSRRHGWKMVGQPKKALTTNIGSGQQGGTIWENLIAHESRFDLIEHKRLEVAAQLAAMGIDE